MYKYKKYYVTIFLILFIGSICHSQNISNEPEIINKKSGLPTDRVNSIIKDDMGFMWFATYSGICRWDGVSAKVFKYDSKDSTTISGNIVLPNAFYWDSKSKQIIFGTENGLTFFDTHTQKAINYFYFKDTANYFLSSINSVYVDRQDKIWIGTKFGIVRYNRINNAFTKFTYNKKVSGEGNVEAKSMYNIFDIKQDIRNDSILWIAAIGGLLKFNKYSNKFSVFTFMRKIKYYDNNSFTTIVVHPNLNIYIGTWNADLLVFNTVEERFDLSYGPFSSNENYFLSPLIPSKVKSNNELWVSSKQGIGIFNTDSNDFNIVKTFINDGGRKFISRINYIDSSDVIWMSSEYGHLF